MRFEIPRNVRTVRTFLGLTAKGWGWAIAVIMMVCPILHLWKGNPFITIGAAVFIYFFVKATYEIDENTGLPKAQLIVSSYMKNTKKQKLSLTWGEDLHENNQKSIRSYVKGEKDSAVEE